jgi:hypothetical protein
VRGRGSLVFKVHRKKVNGGRPVTIPIRVQLRLPCKFGVALILARGLRQRREKGGRHDLLMRRLTACRGGVT